MNIAKIDNFLVLPVAVFNQIDMERWANKPEGLHKSDIAFVGFRKSNGQLRKYGFVCTDKGFRYAFFAYTAKEAREKAEKGMSLYKRV